MLNAKEITEKPVLSDNEIAAESVTYCMNTVVSYKAYGAQAQAALKAAEKETARLEKMLSRYIEDSDISSINRAAGKNYVKVSGETYTVLLRAAEVSRRCVGCFDITVGPLVDLWRMAKDKSKLPEAAEIKHALKFIDYNDIEFSPRRSVRLRRESQSIDLGGIGKGYAADMVIGVFKRYGISSAFTNFGGNVAAIGTKPDESPWRIGIRHPREEGRLIGAVSVEDKSVVTSGDYQRCFKDGEGKAHHHILDPHTGYPSESGLISVTVVADGSMDADALSTALFVAGKQKGLELLKSFPGAEAILVDADLNVTITQGLKNCFWAVEGIKTNIFK